MRRNGSLSTIGYGARLHHECEFMQLYAAKLLFQFRHTPEERRDKRRLCEERIILFEAASGKRALAVAKRRGKASQHAYRNCYGQMVHFEFVGVMDLLPIGPECEPGEVWYELRMRKLPMERKSALIPDDARLLRQVPDLLFRNEPRRPLTTRRRSRQT